MIAKTIFIIAALVTISKGCYGFLKWYKSERSAIRPRLLQVLKSDKVFVFFLILTFCSAMIALFYLQINAESSFEVYKPFQPAYEKYKSKLGKPIGNVVKENENKGYIYQASHEHAMILYSMNDMNFYFLNDNSTWEKYRDKWDRHPALKNDDELRKLLHLPDSCDPPYAGVARLWNLDPKKFNWMGGRKWHCRYNQGAYQYFERGTIIGNFPRIKNDKIHKSLLYVLTDDGQWESEPSGEDAPQCDEPIQLSHPIKYNPSHS